jgi:hypothetical protein
MKRRNILRLPATGNHGTARPQPPDGFTLVETLFALAAVVLAAGVLFTSQAQCFLAENRANILEGSLFQVETLVTRYSLRLPVEVSSATGTVAWLVQSKPVTEGNEAARARWRSWELTETNNPGLKTIVYLRRR